MLNHTHSNCIA